MLEKCEGNGLQKQTVMCALPKQHVQLQLLETES